MHRSGAILILAFLGLMMSCTPAQEQVNDVDVAGKWALTYASPMGGEVLWTLTCQQEGSSFSGTAETDMGTVNIGDGTVEADNISFKIALSGADSDYELIFLGTVDGDIASGMMSGLPGDEIEWTAERKGE